MRNCASENNNGDAYAFYLPNLVGTSAPASIRLENCTSVGCSRAVSITTTNGHADGDLQGSMEFVDCTFEGSRNGGIIISGKPADACSLRFERCSIIDPAAEAPGQFPIAFGTRPGNVLPLGGVEFVDCTVQDSVERPPMSLHDWAGSIKVEDVTGMLTVVRGDERTDVEITPETLAEWMPTFALREIAPFDGEGVEYVAHDPQAGAGALAAPSFRLRRAAQLALYASEGDEVSFTVRYDQVAKYNGKPMPVRIVAPSESEVAAVTAAFQEDTPVAFTAPETGLYEVDLDPGANWAQVLDATHPMCLVSTGEGLRLYSSQGDLFLWVPAEAEEFAVRVYGESQGEAVRAALYDATGELVEDQDNITRPHQFVVERQPTRKGEVWRLHISRATDIMMEDYYVLLEGLPPMLAWTPEGLIVPAGE
jgi:hypothetical protein